jgi:hypothetical protein
LPSILRLLATRAPELRLAVRVTTAAVLAFGGELLGTAATGRSCAIIVMQTSVGGSLKAAVECCSAPWPARSWRVRC